MTSKGVVTSWLRNIVLRGNILAGHWDPANVGQISWKNQTESVMYFRTEELRLLLGDFFFFFLRADVK